MARCNSCGREYRQEWTMKIHERKCKEKKIAETKHPDRYKVFAKTGEKEQ